MSDTAISLCFDFNGVLLDTQAGLRALIARELGAIVPTHMSCKEAVGKSLENVTGGRRKTITRDQYERVKDKFFAGGDLFLEAPPIAGAAEVLHQLHEHGFALSIVSNCATLSPEQIRMWLERHQFPHEHINITLPRKRRPKELHCRNYDVVIDNEVKHLVPLARQRHGPIPILFFPRRVLPEIDQDVASKIIVCRKWDNISSYLVSSLKGASGTLQDAA